MHSILGDTYRQDKHHLDGTLVITVQNANAVISTGELFFHPERTSQITVWND